VSKTLDAAIEAMGKVVAAVTALPADWKPATTSGRVSYVPAVGMVGAVTESNLERYTDICEAKLLGSLKVVKVVDKQLLCAAKDGSKFLVKQTHFAPAAK
jgi:hypothetical protein